MMAIMAAPKTAQNIRTSSHVSFDHSSMVTMMPALDKGHVKTGLTTSFAGFLGTGEPTIVLSGWPIASALSVSLEACSWFQARRRPPKPRGVTVLQRDGVLHA